MPISAQECLEFAAEMDRMARRTADEDARRRMLDIARTWRELARQMSSVPASESD
jgi:hypothetical protein